MKKRHRVVRRAGAVVEAACGISANPYYSVQRLQIVNGGALQFAWSGSQTEEQRKNAASKRRRTDP